jgi:hypothetical protein
MRKNFRKMKNQEQFLPLHSPSNGMQVKIGKQNINIIREKKKIQK